MTPHETAPPGVVAFASYGGVVGGGCASVAPSFVVGCEAFASVRCCPLVTARIHISALYAVRWRAPAPGRAAQGGAVCTPSPPHVRRAHGKRVASSAQAQGRATERQPRLAAVSSDPR